MAVVRMATLMVDSAAVPPAEAGSAASTAPVWLPAARAQKPNPEPASGATCSPDRKDSTSKYWLETACALLDQCGGSSSIMCQPCTPSADCKFQAPYGKRSKRRCIKGMRPTPPSVVLHGYGQRAHRERRAHEAGRAGGHVGHGPAGAGVREQLAQRAVGAVARAAVAEQLAQRRGGVRGAALDRLAGLRRVVEGAGEAGGRRRALPRREAVYQQRAPAQQSHCLLRNPVPPNFLV